MKSIKIRMGYDATIVIPADPNGFLLVSQLVNAQVCEEKHSADYRTTYLVRSKAKYQIEVSDFELIDDVEYKELRAKQDAEAEAAKAEAEAAKPAVLELIDEVKDEPQF